MPEKEWTLFMSGETYLKVADAAKILGFGSVEEMFPEYHINTTGLLGEGEVMMGKNVVLGDLLVPAEEAPTFRLPGSTLIYPMTTTQQWTITNTANSDAIQASALQTIAEIGR